VTARRSIDAFGPLETQAFWAMMRFQAGAVAHLNRDDMPEDMREARDGTYRLSFICPACDAEHRVEGDFVNMAMASQVLLLQGTKSVAIEPLAYALAMDAEEANHMVETQKPEDGAVINHAIDRIFAGGGKKP